ncbi:MAG: hypothetical protein EZS28_024274 [Streblomastix strix]|uniref:Uncharacterized protein n=1 Tax=Streblomastix strix TaxID=222440 RepID=A0A5J4VCE5_9EUKA|nr:MAG: hypothetical protein EZS28_024274 [Streblomastix strix]
MRNRAEIDENIFGIDMESEGNEQKNVRGKKVKIDTSFEEQVQCNIQEQKHKDKITSSAGQQTATVLSELIKIA